MATVFQPQDSWRNLDVFWSNASRAVAALIAVTGSGHAVTASPQPALKQQEVRQWEAASPEQSREAIALLQRGHPKPVRKNNDGSVIFSNGVTYSSEHHYTTFRQGPVEFRVMSDGLVYSRPFADTSRKQQVPTARRTGRSCHHQAPVFSSPTTGGSSQTSM